MNVANNASAGTFDFDAAVAAALRGYPQETRNITFVDLSSPHAPALIADWYLAIAPAGAEKRDVLILSAKDARKNGLVRVDHPSGKTLLAAGGKPRAHYLGADDAKEAAFAFDHELGHALLETAKGAETDATVPATQSEMAADVFAVLRGIASGAMTRKEAQNLSLARAMKTPGIHLTSQAIDALLADKTDAEIKSLAPSDIKELANGYGRDYAPEEGEIESLTAALKWVRAEDNRQSRPKDAFKVALKTAMNKITRNIPGMRTPENGLRFRHLKEAEWLENLADVCEEAKEGSLTKHITAKILARVLETGKAGFPEERTFDVRGSQWDKARRKLPPPS